MMKTIIFWFKNKNKIIIIIWWWLKEYSSWQERYQWRREGEKQENRRKELKLEMKRNALK